MARRATRTTKSEEEETPPTSRRGRARNYDEDEAPRSERGRRADRDEDEPRERTKSQTVGKGWGGYSEGKERTKSGDYVNAWKVPTEPTLIKVLDAEPFCTYDEHWPRGIHTGKRSFICLGEDCPLCDIGERASGYALFNILDLSDPDNPKNEFWKVGVTVGDVLYDLSQDKKTSPINREDVYLVVKRTEKKTRNGTRYNTSVTAVKARDIEEDYDCVPLTAEELAEYEEHKFNEEQVLFVTSRKALEEVAEDLQD